MRTAPVGVTLALLVTFSSLGACNAILGIEEATLDDSASASTATCARPGYADPDLECSTGTTTCEECIAECSPTLVSDCLRESACRQALVNYRLCIGEDCRDPDGSCRGCFGGSALASALGRCLEGCSNECQGSGIAKLCEVYCTCMQQTCGLDYVSTCEAECASRPVWKTFCWWEHCERAPTLGSEHCGHATTRDDQCPAKRGIDETCDPPLRWDNSPCANKEECCSGVCTNEKCVGD